MAKYSNFLQPKLQILIVAPFVFNSSGEQERRLREILDDLSNKKVYNHLIESSTVMDAQFFFPRNFLLFQMENCRQAIVIRAKPRRRSKKGAGLLMMITCVDKK